MITKDRIVAAFDGIAPHIAILDAAGKIVHVNKAWRRFADENDCADAEAYLGQNYLDIVRRSAWTGDKFALEALDGIAAVLSGAQQRFSQQYPCHAPGVERWFLMTATRVSEGGDVVIAHDDVTPWVRPERVTASTEERPKLSLDAGQIGTFEVDLEKEVIVFDSQEAKLLGLPDDMHRLSLADFNRMIMDPETMPFEARIAKAGDRFADELHLKLPDSSEHWLTFAAAAQTNVRPGARRYTGLSFDVTERRLNEDRNRLFTREVRHRAKNLLAVVLAIARQTAGKKDPFRFADEFTNRITALSSTLDLLWKSDWRGVDIHDLFKTHFDPFAEARDRVTFAGPSVTVRPEAVQMLGVALHELATNSLKYGALSTLEGRISIEWRTAPDLPDKEFHLTWLETDGPEVKPPMHKGFGYSVLMEQAAWALSGKVEVQYPRSGLIWKLWAPLQEIAADLPID
jgi:two-component sensor histidine kinase/PAS domain-containing protein